MKPRIRLLRPHLRNHLAINFAGKTGVEPKYYCIDNSSVQGFGVTPKAAYDSWKQKDVLRSRTPRHMIWNRIECRRWYYEGCPPINVNVFGKHIVGYDPSTDELILRG